jgi:hypothetical protein
VEGGVFSKIGAAWGGGGVGWVGGLLKEAEEADRVGIVSERAGGSKFANRTEAGQEVGVGEVKGGGSLGCGLGSGAARGGAVGGKAWGV